MIMPDSSGRDLFNELKKINPDVKAIISSGYSFNEEAQKIIDDGAEGFISKPYSLKSLSEKLSEL